MRLTAIERAYHRERKPGDVGLEKLRDIAATIGLNIEYQPNTRVHGWPQKSTKPWSLRNSDWTLLCAFRTLAQLETNLRGRAGC